jgi:hypothetical protein
MSDDKQTIRTTEKENVMTKEEQEELIEKFYVVREQRNRLLWACRKVLDVFDAANASGKSKYWSGDDVVEMRMAVANASAIYQPTKLPGFVSDGERLDATQTIESKEVGK